MPSASTKPENKASPEAISAIQQALNAVEKKVRNLEKRKGKLDGYREKKRKGDQLNEDQQDAIDRYDSVIQNLEFARELQKQFFGINADNEKVMRKQRKRENLEKQNHEIRRLREVLALQNLLDSMGSEEVRLDFKEGKRGAVVLTDANLKQFDDWYKLISPTRDGESSYEELLAKAAEHISAFLDGKDKEVAGTTYKQLKEMMTKVAECGYFDKSHEEEEDNTNESEEKDYVVVKSEEVPKHNSKEVSSALPPDVPHPVAVEKLEQSREEGKAFESEADAYYEQSDSSSQSAAKTQRPFQEIVSSVQGSFNFLQDSQIEMEGGVAVQHMDPAIVATRPMAPGMAHDPTLVQGTYQSSSLLQGDDQISHPTTGTQQTNVPQQHLAESGDQYGTPMGVPTSQTQSLVGQQGGLESSYGTESDYSQNRMSQNLTNSSQPSYGLESSNSLTQSMGMDQVVSFGTGTDGPPVIPLPSQQGLQNQSMGSADQSQSAQEKKPSFVMNPEAAMFTSNMYQSQSGMQSSNFHSTDMSDGDKAGYQKSYDKSGGFAHGSYQTNDYNGSSLNGSSNYGPRSYDRNGRGRGGRGNRGMSNGYQNNRGGRGGGGNGGSYNNRRGGYENRGGSGRGGGATFQGYPPKNDYKPVGFQGFNKGFSSSGLKKNYGPRGGGNSYRGGQRGGRGNNPRGGFAGSRSNSGPQSQVQASA